MVHRASTRELQATKQPSEILLAGGSGEQEQISKQFQSGHSCRHSVAEMTKERDGELVLQ